MRVDRRLVSILMSCFIWATVGAAEDAPEVFHDQSTLVPDTTIRDPVLSLDFSEIHIGVAEYSEGPTGATVFYFPEPVMAVVDVRGGAPGVINSEPLRLHYDAAYTNAICFAGGSSYGLAAATGVAAAIKERTENPGHWDNIAFVPGAIIFDLGGRRFNAVTPDYELGKAALRSAQPGRFPLGAQGAGRFAMQGWFLDDPQHSGQGGAFRQVGQTKIAVFTVVNPGGSVADREGKVVRCSEPSGDGCGFIGDRLAARLNEKFSDVASRKEESGLTSNTTITLVVTNEKLSIGVLQRLAVQVHTSMGRAIQPFSGISDGDTLYAVTTGQVKTEGLSANDLGVLAADVAWDAVLASVPRLPEPGLHEPVVWTSQKLDAAVGEYRFSLWDSMQIEREGDGLVAHGPETWNPYFPSEETVALIPVSDDELRLEGKHRFRIRLHSQDGRVSGLTLEPGPWAIPAVRSE